MAENSLLKEIIIRAKAEGINEASKDIEVLQVAIDTVGERGNISNQTMGKLNKTVYGTADAAKQASASLPTLRYAMYDIAQTAGIMSAAFGAAGSAVLIASGSFESSFTAVERTSGVAGNAALQLRDDLISLSRAIPQSFGEIANIAARGAQLGIASQDLDEFTQTVAQFVATSDTVSLDQAVEAFGRISNLLGDKDFNRIGSAITLVGVNAAATEAQIVKTTQELAPFATAVGMSADQTIALAAALGSLGQPPERARSAFLTLQRVMDTAIASGSDKLYAFANLLNTSVDEVTRLWQQDPSQFIDSFAQSLGGVEDLTTAFADLGINERRAVQVFQALAADSRNAGDGLSVLGRALEDSAQGYSEGTELARQYGLIVDDLASKWQLFLNSVKEFTAGVGDALAPLAKGILDIATAVVQMMSNLSKTSAGKFFTATAAGIAGLVFILTSAVGSFALLVASLAAARTGLTQLTLASGGSLLSMKALRAEVSALAVSMGISTRALGVFKVALASTGIGLAVVALGALTAAFMQASETAEQAFSRFAGSGGGLSEAIGEDTQNFLSGVVGSYEILTPVLEQNSAALDDNAAAIQGAATILGITAPEVDNVSGAIERNTQVLGDNAIAWFQNQLFQSEAFQELSKNADFVDYWQVIGADFVEVTRIAATQGEEAVLQYFLRLERAYEEGQRALGAKVTTTQGAFNSMGNLQAGWMGGRGIGGGVFGNQLGKSLNDITKTAGGFKSQLDLLGASANRTRKAVGGLSEEGEDLNTTLDNLGGSGGGSAGKAAGKIRTLLDYSGDLAKVWGRAFDIRFSGQSTLDTITSSFLSIREAADAAAKRIRDLNNDIRSLSSDISIQEYFLSIAVEYGDTKRAAAIEAELAKKRAELADKTSDLQKQQEAASKSLTGTTQGAIENRKQILDLVKQYQSHIEALAASGMSQDQLAIATQRLKADFLAQATQLGYNRAELEIYAKSFDDVAIAIAKVPRNITVSANVNPAIQAFNEMKAAADRASSSASGLRNNLSSGFPTGGINTSPIVSAGLAAEAAMLRKKLMDAQFAVGSAKGTALFPYSESGLRARLSQLQGMGFASGGFTGRGGVYEPAGIVHKGEYVIPKRDVNQSTGLPYADALGRLMGGVATPASSVAASSSRAPGVQVVALSAGSIEALRGMSDKIIVLDGQVIAESTSQSYQHSNNVGAN